mmetsp:Transcript_94603/g.267311  ORF Transcript_94603/g.267311 Transcript_94603/m.267311 type:complete len:234 (-) Transcript_94603:66-767(-)
MGHQLSCLARDKTQKDGEKKALESRGLEEARLSDHAEVGPSSPCTRAEVQMLSDRMDTMQSSISALQSENDRLQSISLDLENDNQTLRSTLSEQNTHREWKRFDIIERHYKQLEQHRQRRLSGDFGSCSGTEDANSAAGALQQEDNGTSTPRDEIDLEFFLAEGVQTRSMATPRPEWRHVAQAERQVRWSGEQPAGHAPREHFRGSHRRAGSPRGKLSFCCFGWNRAQPRQRK